MGIVVDDQKVEEDDWIFCSGNETKKRILVKFDSHNVLFEGNKVRPGKIEFEPKHQSDKINYKITKVIKSADNDFFEVNI